MHTTFIKTRMYQLGISQTKLADDMGISLTYLSQMINGNANPTLKKLNKLAEHLKCDTGDLFKKEGNDGSIS